MVMDVSTEQVGEVSVITLRGRLDGSTCGELETQTTSAIATFPICIIDMAGLDYVSSAGLRILLKAAKQAKARQVKLRLCSLHPNVQEVFSISGFMTIFSIFANRDEAISAST
jgi:anti-anti-sigma factor